MRLTTTFSPRTHSFTGSAACSKNKPKQEKRQWNGDREEFKQRGRMIWFNRLLAQGKTEAAAAFAHQHNLPTAGQLSVARTSIARESQSGLAVSPHSTPTTESTSDGETGNQQEQAGESSTALPPPSEPASDATGALTVSSLETETRAGPAGNDGRPVASVPLSKLSLREQLMRQIAEMDAAERAAGAPMVAPALIQPEVNPVAEPPKPVVVAPAPVVAPEPVKQPVAPLPNSPAGVRPAIVWNFLVNPRLIRIKFLDTPEGSPPEFASMLIDRVGMRMNDKVEVVLSEGTVATPIYRETRKRT